MTEAKRTWRWRDIHFLLPVDWEMLRFSKDVDDGSCGFADGEDFTFFLYWQRRKRSPDYARDAKKFTRKREDAEILGVRDDGWFAWKGRRGEHPLLEAGKHFAEGRLALTAVFLGPASENEDLVADILSSIEVTPTPPGEDQLWQIADFTCRVPGAEPLHKAIFQAGKTELIFRRNPKKEPVYHFHKLAGLDEWMPSRDIERWLKRQVPSPFRAEAVKRADRGDHQYVSITGAARHRFFPLRLSPRRYFEMVAWICPEEDCLYAVSQQCLNDRGAWGEPVSLPLRCCQNGPVLPS